MKNEFYEANEDAVENFDSLNDVYRNTWDWIVNTNIVKYVYYLLARRPYSKNRRY